MENVDIVVVGAGFGGLGMATRLARHTDKEFVVLERGDDVGGTWRDNHYPGAACDVPSHLYSFSFRPKPDWSRLYAPQQEILEYLQDTVREEGLQDRIRLRTELLEARWSPEDRAWTIRTNRGTLRAAVLISAVGHLSEPRLPEIDGLEDFGGALFHSAAWPEDVELRGRRVGVIGSGATAVQVVPQIAEDTSRLVVFQRSAPWITPRRDRSYAEAEKRMFARMPAALEAERAEIFWTNEERYAQRRGTPHLVEAVTKAALDHLHRQVDDPELVRRLTPDYTLGCKRVLRSDDYYPALARPHVVLETDGIERVVPEGVLTRGGTLHELDVLVACTGFEATDLPISYQVHGTGGQRLSDAWVDGMRALGTTSVHGFPNLWVVNGPNTGLGHNSAVYIAEAQIAQILAALEHMQAHGIEVLEADAAAEEQFMAEVERMAQGTVWLEGGCRSWYVDRRNGRLTTLWPESAYSFRRVNGRFDPARYRQRAGQPVPG